MDSNTGPLWVHAYSGRENGLMVVGDRASLEALGRRLIDAEPVTDRLALPPGWPPAIAAPAIVGHTATLRDFSFRFI
jgi:hypothetical protein